jgi:hypothetical protein
MDTYRATNTLNGKFYIGSATDFERRKKEHLTSKANYPFQNALRNNPDAFIWEVWSDDSDERELEQALLDMWFGKEQCYNLNPVASHPPRLIGALNPRFGLPVEENPHYGKRWWVNEDGTLEKFCLEKPEGDWIEGRKEVSHTTRKKQSEKGAGLYWWVNPDGLMLKRKEQPGPEWVNGMNDESKESFSKANKGSKNPAFGKKWWINAEGEKKYQPSSPGPEWQNGRVYRPGLGV